MAELLSHYQIAVLQEIGIPVWQARSMEPPACETRTALPAAPSAISPEDKLARLRSTIAPDDEHKTPQTKRPPLKPLSDTDPLVKDVYEALYGLGICSSDQRPGCYQGTQLEIRGREVILPSAPGQLQPGQKKALWQAMCEIAAGHGD